jgi:hypothetical protein
LAKIAREGVVLPEEWLQSLREKFLETYGHVLEERDDLLKAFRGMRAFTFECARAREGFFIDEEELPSRKSRSKRIAEESEALLTSLRELAEWPGALGAILVFAVPESKVLAPVFSGQKDAADLIRRSLEADLEARGFLVPTDENVEAVVLGKPHSREDVHTMIAGWIRALAKRIEKDPQLQAYPAAARILLGELGKDA